MKATPRNTLTSERYRDLLRPCLIVCSVYGPVVCMAHSLANCAEPGSLRVSAATHSRLAGEWPWARAPPRPVRLSDGWSLRVTDVDADAVALAKERSRYGELRLPISVAPWFI